MSGARVDCVTSRQLAVVRDYVTTAAAYRETKLTVTLKDALVELEIPDQVDRYGLANVVIQEPITRHVHVTAREHVELLSGAARINENVTIHISGPYRSPIPVTA